MSHDTDLVERIYGFNWAAVGSREVGFEEIEAIVSPEFESRTSPELGGRVLSGVPGLRELSYALEADFEQLEYRPTEYLDAGDGTVVVTGRVEAVGRSSGMPLSGEFGHVWHIDDGLAHHVEAYRDAADARKAGGVSSA